VPGLRYSKRLNLRMCCDWRESKLVRYVFLHARAYRCTYAVATSAWLLALVLCASGLALSGCGREKAPPPEPPKLSILTTLLPEGNIGLQYSSGVLATGGTPPLSWGVSAGSLPPGLELDAKTGAITGTPTQLGLFNFTVRITDSGSPAQTATQDLSIDIRDTTALVELISQASNGTRANADSGSPAISADGRYVVFSSLASNLVPNDTNGHTDIFIRDRVNATTARVSVPHPPEQTSLGAEANGTSFAPAISADGHFVAYTSSATNLVANDTNNLLDIFLTELDLSGTTPAPIATTRVSVALNLADQPADIFSATTIGNSTLTMTPDEHKDRLAVIVAGSGQGQVRKIVLNDATTLTVDPAWTITPDSSSVFRVISQSDGESNLPFLSNDARTVAFQSAATNLVANDTNSSQDIFVHDRITGQTSRVSVRSDGGEQTGASSAPYLSADGLLVVFQSAAQLAEQDTDYIRDVYLHDRDTATTVRLSLASGATPGNSTSSVSSLSANGRFALFVSSSNNLVTDDTNSADDLFLRDRDTAETSRVSLANDGSEANASSDFAADISGAGRLVVFSSSATNLVSGDTNEQADIFLRDRQAATTTRISLALGGTQPNAAASDSVISADGSVIAFSSAASNFVLNDTNNARDIFAVATGRTDAPLIVFPGPPAARLGQPYAATPRAVGGTKPLFWAIAAGLLPPGISLDPLTGALSGLPVTPGEFHFTLLVMDNATPRRLASKRVRLVVVP